MASNTPGLSLQTTQELCKYFLANACRYGDQCTYSHDRTLGEVNNTCRFYLQGRCSYGDRCRYDHVRPKLPQTKVAAPLSIKVDTDPPIKTSLSNLHLAPEFVPAQRTVPNGTMSYASVCRLNNSVHESSIQIINPYAPYEPYGLQSLCPYAEKSGFCELHETGNDCPYIHGDICDICELPVLHPFDEQQREQHRSECIENCHTECETAFAIQRSENKNCGVCLETVWDRDGDTRFGILENCDHVFCLECIRKWRASSTYDNRVIKACPECRVKSDFVTPAQYWPENQESKQALIEAYKQNLRQIHCKLFNRGEGTCPFGSKCFYLHVDMSGRQVNLDAPRRLLRMNAEGEVENYSNRLHYSIFANDNIGPSFAEYDSLFYDEDEVSDSEISNDDNNHRTDYTR